MLVASALTAISLNVCFKITFIKDEIPDISCIEDGFELYIFGKEYGIKNLQQLCTEFIEEIISLYPSTVCPVHDFACEQNDYNMQFTCWVVFDEFWEEIFQTDDFLCCKDTTITRLISRPIYETLDELSLFDAVDDWINARILTEEHLVTDKNTIRKRRKELIRPFLPKLRLLAIEKIDMENLFDMLELLLTEHEMQAIRDFFTSKDYPNADLSNFPETLCTNKKERHDEINTSFFKYNFKCNFPIGKEISLADNVEIVCHILVMEDCFLTDISLPIHFSENKIISIDLYICEHASKQSMGLYTLECNNEGNAYLFQPHFLKKNSKYLLSSKVLENDDDKQMDIRILPDAHSFLIAEKKISKNEKIEFFYFDVTLYF
ncbi:uncharacterized protein LOC111631326 [Centruroides sculpturatus]|uniref:uncharacterized protein LOC111631326 n=1 Tax=Centruroides sculpturatus TaxID=218467 RepID=UPI000C6CBA37|nr:uncharacterized protein LOC111631326 [Centruroides sculpturatus]